MKTLLVGCAALAAAACGPAPIETTSVSSPIGGPAFMSPAAITHASESALDATWVLITDVADACDHTQFVSTFEPEGVSGPNGTRGTALVLSDGTAYLDVTGAPMRIASTKASMDIQHKDDDGTLHGSFDATFGTSGEFTGTFVAKPCTKLGGGCSSAPGACSLALVALLSRRKRSAAR